MQYERQEEERASKEAMAAVPAKNIPPEAQVPFADYNDGCTTNTVIHYHAVIRKALQSAVKKDILSTNPADKVDRPKKAASP